MFLLLIPFITSCYILIICKRYNLYLNLTGVQYARQMLDYDNQYNVVINIDNTNRIDPTNNTIYLSNNIYYSKTLLAACISIYTCFKYNKNKRLILIDNIIRILSTFFYWLLLISYILKLYSLLSISINVIIICILYKIFNLPSEFNNYYRAYNYIYKYQLINNKYIKNNKKILFSIIFFDMSRLIMYPITKFNYLKRSIN